MSINDLNRLEVLTSVQKRELKRSKAAQILGVSQRQLRRMLRRFKAEGPKGVISRKIGSKGNRSLAPEKKALIVDFFRDPDHYDFEPTLTQEYLLASGSPKIRRNTLKPGNDLFILL